MKKLLKKGGLINSTLVYEIARLGHKDMFVIADAGLPIPPNVVRIDLAVVPGIPRFLDVLEAILKEVVVEKAIIAEETKRVSPHIYDGIVKLLEKYQSLNIKKDLVTVSHEEFKRKYVSNARFVVRTGEFTPYANIVLVSGVPF